MVSGASSTLTATSGAAAAAYSGSSALLTPWDRVISAAPASPAAPTVTVLLRVPVVLVLKVSVFVGAQSRPASRSVPAWPVTVTVTSPAGWDPRTTE